MIDSLVFWRRLIDKTKCNISIGILRFYLNIRMLKHQCTHPMSTFSVLFSLLIRWFLPDKMNPRVVVPKITVMKIKTIAITIQVFNEQYALPFFTTQFCTGEHWLSRQLCSNSNPISPRLFSWTDKEVTFDELLNIFPLK